MKQATDETDYEYTWELPLEFTEALFKLMGWTYAFPEEKTVRTPEGHEIEAMATKMLAQLHVVDRPQTYMTLGRLLVYKDPEFEDSYEVYLHLGYATRPIPEGER
ncbi:hypothetical protein [Nonomuraea recticatena]|uniref:Uncharacterized protein n=1 Tax=Nonomuraea recticatena TaxID=46178 RepID=A0ABN3SYG9_9ACTN